MTTILVDRAQLEQWLQAFKKIHGDKRSHWDVDEEISAIEKSLEPIAMDVMKTDEADFWRWWKPYQLKDCWRLELVARDAWMASKAALKPKEPEQSDVVSGKTFDRIVALNESNAARVLELEEKLEALAQAKHNPVGFYDAENKDLRREIPMGEDGDWWQPVYTHPPVPTAQPEQEPVAWLDPQGDAYCNVITASWKKKMQAMTTQLEQEHAAKHIVPVYTTPPQRKPQFKEFIKWAGAQGYDCAQTCNSDTGEWIVLNPMTADLWKAWQAAHSIKGDA